MAPTPPTPPAPPNADGAAAPSILERIYPYVRMFFMWYAFQSIVGMVLPSPSPSTSALDAAFAATPSTPEAATPDVANTGAVDPTTTATTTTTTTTSAQSRRPRHYRNSFEPGDLFALRVYLSRTETFSFADLDPATEQEQLRWHEKHLPYASWGNEYGTLPDEADGQWVRQLNVTVDDHLLRNGSLYAHVFATKMGFSPNPEDADYDRTATMHATTPLTIYRPRPAIVHKRNLLGNPTSTNKEEGDDDGDNDAVATRVADDDTYISMWKPTLTTNVVFDTTVYTSRSKPPPFLAPHLTVDQESSTYSPVLHVNEFWLLDDALVPINGSLATLPLTLTFYPLPLYKFALYTQMEQNFANQERTGTSTRRDTDSMKRLFVDTNPYLLAVTMVVSLLHSLFDFLAFKNDVSFWKNQKSLAGLSLRTVVLNTFFQLVIFLYLLDNETSWMILFSSLISLVIDCWKIKKAISVTRDATTNRLVVTGVDSYQESPTAEHDRVAVAHLSFVLYPLIVGQALYSLTFGVHKGWYSWVLSSLTSFVYAFGFIMMTPQLYINYKLQSVAHLPWRAMVYKSLNTFIDDLFAFVIKMPWMHRLSCFRDDLIFFIYLYQRWIYPVDATRTNEYGQGGETEEAENARAHAVVSTSEGGAALGHRQDESAQLTAEAEAEVEEAVAATEEVAPRQRRVVDADAETRSATEYHMSTPLSRTTAAAGTGGAVE